METVPVSNVHETQKAVSYTELKLHKSYFAFNDQIYSSFNTAKT